MIPILYRINIVDKSNNIGDKFHMTVNVNFNDLGAMYHILLY